MGWISVWYIILVIILILVISISSLAKTNFLLRFYILYLIIFSGLRYGVGIDYYIYEYMILSDRQLNYIEPLSRSLLLLSRKFQAPVIFFLSTSAIYIISIVIGLKKFNVYGIFTIFIFTLFPLSLLTSYGIVRQYVATGILFIAFSYLYKGRYMYYLFLCGLATLFHFSAIVFISFVFFNKAIHKKWNILILLAAIPVSFLSNGFVAQVVMRIGLYAHYFEKFGGNAVTGKKIYYSLLFVTLILLLLQHYFISNRRKTKLHTYSQNMVIICIFLYGVFIPFGEHLARICYYLVPFYYIWLYSIYKLISESSLKKIYLLFVFSICMIYYFTTLYYAQFSSRGDFLNNYELAI